jgi:hypothetical protein
MNTDEIIKKAQDEFTKLSKIPLEGAIGLSKVEEGWSILLEALERKAIPDSMDILGVYEIRLDSEGNLLSFERKKLRKRADTVEQ